MYNTIVGAFFKRFLLDIISKDLKTLTLDDLEPRQVKMTVATHIEEVAPRFNEEMFYTMMCTNYSAEEAEPMLRAFVAEYVSEHEGKQPGYMELLPFACRTPEAYDSLIEAYRHHFMLLMDGVLECSV